jgi:hypothetical protein
VWLQVLLGCTAALFVIAAFAVFSVRSAADSYYGPNGVTNYGSAQTWVDREDTANAVIGFAGLLSIAVAVLMIIWAFQLTRAVDRHRPSGRKWSRGWAIGAWFIPVANYFLCPAILMEDEKIAAAAARGNTDDWQGERAHRLTVFWFGAWALGGILSFVGNRAVHATDQLSLPGEHQLMTAYLVLIVGSLVSASAATMAAISVGRMTRLDHGDRASASLPVAAAPVGQSFSPGPNWDL